MPLQAFSRADLVALLRFVDAVLYERGVALMVKDERGLPLFAGRGLVEGLSRDQLGELHRALARDEARVLAGERVARAHETGGAVLRAEQGSVSLPSGSRLIVAWVDRGTDATWRARNTELYTAREDERRKLASQMHDSLAQTLTSLSMHAEVLSSVIQHGIEEARVMLHRLRPPELAHAGLEAALRTLLNDTPGAEGRVQSERNPSEDRLSESQALGLFRMVEALLEPAASASQLWRVAITLGRAETLELQLEVTVHGDDLALDAARLRRIGEPIEAIGGRLQLIACDPTRLSLRAFVTCDGT